MTFQYTPYILPLAAAALVLAVIAFYAWMRRSSKEALMLFFMSAAILQWTVGYIFEIAGTDQASKYFWGTLQYFGIAFVPYAWFMFSIIYSGREKILTRRFVLLTALVPFVTVLLAITTKWHGLIWNEYSVSQQGDFSAVEVASRGAWFWTHFAYSYLLLLVGTILLLQTLVRRKGMYRGQAVALLAAVFVPWIGNALYLTGNSPIPYLDLTPFAFTVTVAALAWAVFGFHLGDITPLARDVVLDSMREGVIVLDTRDHVVDINNAAARMIGVPFANAIGKTAQDIFHPWSHLVNRLAGALEARDEISIGEGNAKRRYAVSISSLQDSQGHMAGRILMLRAFDEDVPQPRFARSAASASPTHPLPAREDDEDTSDVPSSIWNTLLGFYFVPVKKDLPVPDSINPVWYRTRERIFTVITRIAASIGIIALLFANGGIVLRGINIIFAAFLVFLGLLGFARNIQYSTRVVGFLALIYLIASAEVLNFGFSVESFTFFLSFVATSAVMTSRRGAIISLILSVFTLGVFAVAIGDDNFVPFVNTLNYSPADVLSGINSLLAFAASAVAVTTSIVILIENLNSAWQKETQALNLLQQERDLLEQRVQERTHDLADARDQALVISKQMRKYYYAIEQSGSTIVITDVDGNIEYANPMFEKTTGYALADAIGKNPRILKSGAHSAAFYREMWDRLSAGNVWTGEILNKKKSGALYWEFATIAPISNRDGEITNYVAIKEDITARRESEDQLQKLSQAVEQSGSSVIIMDRRGLIEYVNPKFTQVTGYSIKEVSGKSPAFLYGKGDDYDFTQDEAWQMVVQGNVWYGEFENRRKDGGVLWEFATIAPVFNRDGEVTNFVEVKQDITEQKLLQEQLQRQNDYLSILHQMTLDLLNRRDLNDLLQVIVDRSAVLLDAPFSELMLEEDGALVVRAFTSNQHEIKGDRVTRDQAKLSWQAFDTRQPVVLDDYSTWEHHRDVYDAASLHAVADFPIMIGDRCVGVLALGRDKLNYVFTPEQVQTGILFTRLVALVFDNASLYAQAQSEITERKRTESMLLESETRFRQIIENANDIIYRTDSQGNFTYVNPTSLLVMGYHAEAEVLGKNYVDLAAPDWRHRLKRFYDHQFLAKEKNTYFEFPAINAHGETIWFGQSVQLIEEDDRVIGFQAVARDITQLKQAQEALALSRDQALDASRFKSQMLSRVSHELRTPLGGILGYAELLHYKAFGSLSEKQENAVRNIIESTHYLTNIVNDLLDEAQIESRSLSLYYEIFAPADLLAKVETTVSVLAGKKGLNFRAELSPELPGELYSDMTRLQQLIVNLAGNAVKFTSEGEIVIRLTRPAPAQWGIEVQDTGAGIPSEEQTRIFEPFKQVNNSITRENRGSGLGLAITKQLVEIMGGQISLQSEIGKGSLFTITFPITNPPENK